MEKPGRSIALALGIDPDIELDELRSIINERLDAALKPIEVDTGPCKEVIKFGKEANLFEFPFPYCHEGDGGRYSTMQTVIAVDPDTNWVNWGVYRMVIHRKNRVSFYLSSGQQTRAIYHVKFEARNRPMPVCVAIGGDPANFFVSGMTLPEGVDEVDCAGGLRRSPIELVKAETCDILVPANSEIVLEGEIRPYERLDEGPFGEYPLFHHGPRRQGFAMRVHCITYRKDPIIPILSTARGNENPCMGSTMTSTAFYRRLRERGFPVKGVYILPHIPMVGIVISTDVPYPGAIHDMADTLFAMGMMVHFDFTLFVDSDVDPADVEQVISEWINKTNAEKDYHISDRVAPKLLLSGYLDEEDFAKNVIGEGGVTSKIYIDATSKPGSPKVKRMSFETVFPADTQKWVVDNWNELGFKSQHVWKKEYMDKKA